MFVGVPARSEYVHHTSPRQVVAMGNDAQVLEKYAAFTAHRGRGATTLPARVPAAVRAPRDSFLPPLNATSYTGSSDSTDQQLFVNRAYVLNLCCYFAMKAEEANARRALMSVLLRHSF